MTKTRRRRHQRPILLSFTFLSLRCSFFSDYYSVFSTYVLTQYTHIYTDSFAQSASAENPASPHAIPSQIYNFEKERLPWIIQRGMDIFPPERNINMSSSVRGGAETMAEIVLNTVIRGRIASLMGVLLARLLRSFSSLRATDHRRRDPAGTASPTRGCSLTTLTSFLPTICFGLPRTLDPA